MYKLSTKIVRIEVENDQGVVMRLSGSDAEKWMKAVEAQTTYCRIHQIAFPAFQWETIRKTSGSPADR